MKQVYLILVALMFSCANKEQKQSNNNCYSVCVTKDSYFVERLDTLGLVVLYPKFSSVELICGSEPQKTDSTVILFAEAAYTGQCLKEFNHNNIAGDHVSEGKHYRGYACKRNTGAFVYHEGTWQFCYKDYSEEMDKVALAGGSAFAQELIIYNGKPVPIVRKDSNRNQFRALCDLQDNDNILCIIESDSIIDFGEFRERLLKFKVSNAICLDMGSGWNYAWWYRRGDSIVELHPKKHNYCTNWITFYK